MLPLQCCEGQDERNDNNIANNSFVYAATHINALYTYMFIIEFDK